MADLKYLTRLAKEYPNQKAAKAELINLRAILALPKGTEYFLSDLHGEDEAFIHMLKSGSGTIKRRIDERFDRILTEEDRNELASLIYDAPHELTRRKASEEDFDSWCSTSIYRMVEILKIVSSKYSRSRVRRRLPKYWGYAIDELLHADDVENRQHYYTEIINSVIEMGLGEDFITELAESIWRIAIDQLHIIGDIFDRGPHPDRIMDFL
ncbi:MAG: fructose-bisphosphatase class III, partial [Firmicutes bacterium]|nr:fructose-bisphosphatase class III [Bacillota bacterium]